MIQFVWEFVARPGQTLEFERCYAPDGPWAELFRRAPKMEKNDIVIVNLSGRGDKDMEIYSSHV